MIDVQLIRRIDNGVETIGDLYVSGDIIFACNALERSYKDNLRGISCIPPGTYICRKRSATEAIPYLHILIENVPGRDGICIHAGNLYSHSKGCLLLGRGYGDLNKDGQQDILNSRKTFNEFMDVMPDVFKLKIFEAIYKNKHNIYEKTV